MTLSIASNHDQHYTCPCRQVMHGQLDLEPSLNWTCPDCHQKLRIFMDDLEGHSYTVTRQLAKDVRVGATLVHRHEHGLTAGVVTQSHQYGAKPSNWFLTVQGYRGTQIAANSYVNIV